MFIFCSRRIGSRRARYIVVVSQSNRNCNHGINHGKAGPSPRASRFEGHRAQRQAETLLVRPPGTLVPEGLMFHGRCFFYSPGYLRAPSADRRETLPRVRNMGVLYNASPKIRGLPSPQRIWGPKTCKIRRDFRQFQTSIANISGTGQDIQNQKEICSPTIPPAFHEKSLLNFGPLTTEN